jgi:diguanylate cyclase (GGDEF)-like protein/PAS domain S-box-containing protein
MEGGESVSDNTIKRTIEVHERRAMMVDALNKALDIFTTHDEDKFDDVMTNGLQPLAEAMDADRVTFYRYIELDDKKGLKRVCRWGKAQGTLSDPSLGLLPDNQVVSDWLKLAMQNIHVNKHLGNMSETEKSYMNVFGIKSIMVVPIFTHGEFWGVVIFQNHVEERRFDEDCMDLYLSAARMCANAIIRAEMTHRVDKVMDSLLYRKKMLEVLVRAAVALMSRSVALDDDMMTTGVDLVADMVLIDRFAVWRNFPNRRGLGLHASQIFRWDRASGGTTKPNPMMLCVAYSQISPKLEELFTNGEFINGPVSQLPESSVLRNLDIASVFGTPIFINNANWGFVLFADCNRERYFDDISVEMMRSAAFMIANTIVRVEMERDVANKNELSRIMFDAAPIGLTMFDSNYIFIDCNEAVLTMFGVRKQYFIDNFYNLAPEYQPDGSKSLDKIFNVMKQALSGKNLTLEWTHCSPAGTLIPCELTLTRIKYEEKYIGLCYVYDLQHVKSIEQQLESAVDQSYSDPLTGIKNRRYFDEHLKRFLKLLSRSGGVLSLLLIDVDFFKKYNDTYGHIEGDQCLKMIAKTLAASITRADDFVARYGGEEFTVVLPNTDAEGARLIAEKICENVRKCNIPHEKSDAAKYVTVSIGGTTGVVDHTQSENDYIQWADEMLYQSKQEGRNRSSLCLLKK